MKKTDPSRIPEKGERLNQTLLDIGKGNSWDIRTDSRRKALLIKTIVDVGDYEGRKLSCPFFPNETARFQEFRKAIQKPVSISFNAVNLNSNRSVRRFVQQFQEDLRSIRFSALVSPVEFETEQGRYIRYDMNFFDSPTKEGKLNIKSEPTQFMRRQ